MLARRAAEPVALDEGDPTPPGGVRTAVGDGSNDGSIADVSGLSPASGAVILLRGWPGTDRIMKPSGSALRFGSEFIRCSEDWIGGRWELDDALAYASVMPGRPYCDPAMRLRSSPPLW